VAEVGRREEDDLGLGRVIELNLRALKAHHGVTVELAHKLDVGRIRLRRADGWHTSRGFGCGSDGREGGVSQVGQAVDTLEAAVPYEFGSPPVGASYWPMYVRGEAYLRLHNGAKAATEYFAAWKDADPDVPILKEATAEYAKLQ
jgi:hypothetical protein